MNKPAIFLLLAFVLSTMSCNRITEADDASQPEGLASVAIRLSYDSVLWSDSTWRPGGPAPLLERQHRAWFQVELDGDYEQVDSLIVRWGDGQRSTLTRGRVLGHLWADTGARQISAQVWIDGCRLADTTFPLRIVNLPPRPGLRDFLAGRTLWDIDSVFSFLRRAPSEGTERTFLDFDFDGARAVWDDTVAAGTPASWRWPIPAGSDTLRAVRLVERVVDDLEAWASDTIPLLLRIAPPRVRLSAEADTVVLGDTIRLAARATAARGLDSLVWSIDGASRSGRDSLLALPASRPGEVVFAVRALDARGVRGPADTVRVHVRGSLSIASLLAPDSAFPGDTVAFKARATAPAAQSVSWIWTIGEQVIGTGDSIRRAFSRPETLLVTATASIPGLPPVSTSRTLRIVDRAPVVDSVDGVRAILASGATRLCARGHDPDGDTISWRWFRAGSSSVLSTSACFDFAPVDTGSFDFLVKAGDPWGKTGSKTVRIEVGANRLSVDAGDSAVLGYGQPLVRRGRIATNLDTTGLATGWTVILPRKSGATSAERATSPGALFPDSLLRRTPGQYLAIFEARSQAIGILASDTAVVTVKNRPLSASITLLDPADTVLAQDDTVRLVIRLDDPDSALGDVFWKWYDEDGSLRYIVRQGAPQRSFSPGTLIDTLVWPAARLDYRGQAAFTAHVWDRFHASGYPEENADAMVEPHTVIRIVDSMPRIDLWDFAPVLADSLREFRSCFVLPPGRTLTEYRWSLDEMPPVITKGYVPLTTSVGSGMHVLRLTVTDDAGNTTTDSATFVASGRPALPDASGHAPIDRFTAEHPFDAWESVCRQEWSIDRPGGYLELSARHARGGTVRTGPEGRAEDPLILREGFDCSDIVAVFRPDSGSYDSDTLQPAAGFYLVVDNGVFQDSVWMALPIRYLPSAPTMRMMQPPSETILEKGTVSLTLKIAPPTDMPADTKWELRIEGIPDSAQLSGLLPGQRGQWFMWTGPSSECPSGGPCRISSDSLNGDIRIELTTNFDGDMNLEFRAVVLETKDGRILESAPATIERTVHVEAVADDPFLYIGQKEIFVEPLAPEAFMYASIGSGRGDPSELLEIRLECMDPGACPQELRVRHWDPQTETSQELLPLPEGGWTYTPQNPTPSVPYRFDVALPEEKRSSGIDIPMKVTVIASEKSNGSTGIATQQVVFRFKPTLLN